MVKFQSWSHREIGKDKQSSMLLCKFIKSLHINNTSGLTLNWSLSRRKGSNWLLRFFVVQRGRKVHFTVGLNYAYSIWRLRFNYINVIFLVVICHHDTVPSCQAWKVSQSRLQADIWNKTVRLIECFTYIFFFYENRTFIQKKLKEYMGMWKKKRAIKWAPSYKKEL